MEFLVKVGTTLLAQNHRRDLADTQETRILRVMGHASLAVVREVESLKSLLRLEILKISIRVIIEELLQRTAAT